MSRTEALDELAEIRLAIARLRAREERIQAQLSAMDDPHPRPGWPILRVQRRGSMISTSAPSRIAV